MSGLANIAAARGIELGEVTARVEGDIDLLGIFGLDDRVRNGFQDVRVIFHVQGAAEAEQLRPTGRAGATPVCGVRRPDARGPGHRRRGHLMRAPAQSGRGERDPPQTRAVVPA